MNMFIPRIQRLRGADGTLYLTRAMWWRFRIHYFHGPDPDPDMHTHPFKFWTFPLRSYTEQYFYDVSKGHGVGVVKERRVRAWRLHHRDDRFTHRITAARGFTFVMTGRREHSWGFITANGFVHYRKYLNDRQPTL